MEAELVALAAAGATAVVQQMATDGWNRARDRLTGFFADRGTADSESVAAELELARTELVTARREEDEQVAADVQSEWRLRLRRALLADPAAAAELRALLAELTPPSAAQQVRDVHNTVSGTVYGSVVQTGTIGGVHLGASGRYGGPGGPGQS